MLFHSKANYNGHYDADGIPMLDYHGSIGIQYNPIAIAQWGLGNYNLWHDSGDKIYYDKFIKSANWLVKNIEKNKYNLKVWTHHFDFEYRDKLKSPWYSGLAQGQGISVLIRALKETQKEDYKNTIDEALKVFNTDIYNGGVDYMDSNGNHWIEEYIVNPPTHILNGFIWALWGIYDCYIYYKSEEMKEKFINYSNTISNNLNKYDNKYWSKYELSNTLLPMIASQFYHKLHIVQLEIMLDLTSNDAYRIYSNKWRKQLNNSIYRKVSFLHKAIFKVFYY
mgnify:FL=1